MSVSQNIAWKFRHYQQLIHLRLVWCVLQVQEFTGRKGYLQKLKVFTRQAHTEKSFVICGVTSGNADYVKTSWRNSKISLVHSCLIRFTRGQSRYVKSPFVSL
jgi:hypothetical protein